MRLRFVTAAMATACMAACSHKTTTGSQTLPPVVEATTISIPTKTQASEAKSDVTKITVAASKTENKSESLDQAVCELNKEKRTLRIEPVQPKGCDLMYSNFSDEKPVASSRIGMNHCQTTRDRIVGKLEAAGYKCNLATSTSDTPASTSSSFQKNQATSAAHSVKASPSSAIPAPNATSPTNGTTVKASVPAISATPSKTSTPSQPKDSVPSSSINTTPSPTLSTPLMKNKKSIGRNRSPEHQ